MIDRICAEAMTRGNRPLYSALTAGLTQAHRQKLEHLLNLHEHSKISLGAWLRQSPNAPNAQHLWAHLDGLKTLEALRLPEGLEHRIHQNRLLKRAREGAQMTAQHLRDLESTRRHATRVAVVLEVQSTIIERSLTCMTASWAVFSIGLTQSRAAVPGIRQDNPRKDALIRENRHGPAAARTEGTDAFSAIEALISWETFAKIVTATQDLTPREFDDLHRIGDGDAQVRRYAPALLDALQMKVAPAAQDVLSAVETLKTLNAENARKVPQDVPTRFVRKRWESLVFKAEGVDRRFYELCTLSALKNALRSGDLWVQGSRQFKDFGDDL